MEQLDKEEGEQHTPQSPLSNSSLPTKITLGIEFPVNDFAQSNGNISDIKSGWDKTNFLGQEIRLMKIHYKTETEKKWMLIFLTRRDRDDTV